VSVIAFAASDDSQHTLSFDNQFIDRLSNVKVSGPSALFVGTLRRSWSGVNLFLLEAASCTRRYIGHARSARSHHVNMLTRRYFRLRTLGQLTLGAVAGDSDAEVPASVRPRHLAVLTVLAMASRPLPRDMLLEMFWGGETEARARHSLSNALSGLRSLLGPSSVTSRRDHVSLAEEARLEVDVLQFTAACEARDDDRAAHLYRGSFLNGIHVADAPEFDGWVSRERARVERQFLDLCERHVPILARGGRWPEAITLCERWVETAPRSPPAFVALLRAHAGAGTPAALSSAISAYERVKASLSENWGVRTDPSVTALATTFRDQLSVGSHHHGDIQTPESRLSWHVHENAAVVETPTTASPTAHQRPALAPISLSPIPLAASRWTSRRWVLAGAGLATALLAIAAWAALRPPTMAAESKQPIVAVTSIDDVRGDTSIMWLRAGLPRMIATDLGGMGGVEVVAPSRVRDVVVRLAGSSSAHLSDDQAIDVARRVGANWAITGGVSTAKDGYLLDLTVRNVASNGETESFTILANDPIELGRLAARRLVSLLNVVPGGSAPRYSGIETKSPEAYRRLIRGMLAVEAEQSADAVRELDAAIALDSDFVAAIRARRGVAAWIGDVEGERRFAALERRHENRLPEIERLMDELKNVDSLGESSRADALSERLVQRFPRDPRSYSARADLLFNHGRWAAAESLLVRELALDSLAMVAGDGPCTPCEVLWRLSQTRIAEGDRVGAESAARRWASLQPDLPAAWRNLSATLAAVGRSSEAVEAGFHMLALSKDARAAVDFGRTMLSARRFDIVDSLVASWRGSSDPVLADGAVDLSAMLQRERGQFAASVDALSKVMRSTGLPLVEADGLARLGRLSEARAIWEWSGHPTGSARSGQFTAPEARGFSWAHALEADALVRAGDTTDAHVLVDSIARVGQQSAYGRDKVLQHHVRGILLFAEGRFADAERELKAAEWTAAGWTRTNVELARAQLAQRHYADAIATLHNAQLAPLDAMGRYVPHSEVDWWLARVFTASGARDSAATYARYVRDAWKNADAPVRARLDSLPR
jgi:DNA-binding SARP family transcriptional activator/tetratricopeptide (TPR) repeat protein/TolB-like protein